jgi:hypothetical protein
MRQFLKKTIHVPKVKTTQRQKRIRAAGCKSGLRWRRMRMLRATSMRNNPLTMLIIHAGK